MAKFLQFISFMCFGVAAVLFLFYITDTSMESFSLQSNKKASATPKAQAHAHPHAPVQSHTKKDEHNKTILDYDFEGNYDEVSRTIKKDPSVLTTRNIYGQRPIDLAAYHCNKKLFFKLLDNGADLLAKDNKSRSPAHWAVGNNCLDILEYSYHNGIDIDMQDSAGLTQLISAALFGNDDAVSYLISNNADLDIKTNRGESALILAVKTNAPSSEVISLLLEAGADVNIKDNKGKTAINWAQELGHQERVLQLSAALLKS